MPKVGLCRIGTKLYITPLFGCHRSPRPIIKAAMAEGGDRGCLDPARSRRHVGRWGALIPALALLCVEAAEAWAAANDIGLRSHRRSHRVGARQRRGAAGGPAGLGCSHAAGYALVSGRPDPYRAQQPCRAGHSAGEVRTAGSELHTLRQRSRRRNDRRVLPERAQRFLRGRLFHHALPAQVQGPHAVHKRRGRGHRVSGQHELQRRRAWRCSRAKSA